MSPPKLPNPSPVSSTWLNLTMATGPSLPGIWRCSAPRSSKFSPFQSPSPLTGKDFLPSPSPNGDYVPDGAFDPDKSPKNLSTEGAQRRKKGLTRRWGVNGGSRSRLQNGDGNGRARRGRAERARLRSGLRRLGERGRDARCRRLALGLGERKGEEASAWGSAWRWRGRTCCATSALGLATGTGRLCDTDTDIGRIRIRGYDIF